jgi:hypothetical protein
MSDQLFLPEGSDLHVVYRFMGTMAGPLFKGILGHWHLKTRNRHHHRDKFRFIAFTLKKQKNYGFSFLAFDLWRRFARFQRLPKDSLPLSLNFSELNVYWKTFEKRWNYRRLRSVEATRHFQQQIGIKALDCLINAAIADRAERQHREMADQFRLLTLQRLAHRAWLRTMAINTAHKRLTTICFREWYALVYRLAKSRFMTKELPSRMANVRLCHILREWHQAARRRRLLALRAQMKIQENSTVPLALVFLLQGHFTLFYATLCFRGWLTFMSARHRWKAFLRWSMDVDVDEEQRYRLFYNLRRIAQIGLFRRMDARDHHFFPYHASVSLVLTLKVIAELTKESVAGRDRWQFETFKNAEMPPVFSSDALTRALLVRLHQLKQYRLFSTEKKLPDIGQFERTRACGELTTAVEQNCAAVRQRLRVKLAHDLPIVAALVSHISVREAQKMLGDFTVASDVDIPLISTPSISHSPLISFPELEQSVEELTMQTRTVAKRRETDSCQVFIDVGADFDSHLRDPMKLYAERTIGSLHLPQIDLRRNALLQQFQPLRAAPEHSLHFTVDNLRILLTEVGSYEPIIQSMTNFFALFCRTKLDTSHLVHIGSPDEIVPDAPQTKRHLMIRNIGAFLAQIAGVTDFSQIPRRLNAPSCGTDAVTAVLTVHEALRRSSLVQYCDMTPFSKSVLFADPMYIETVKRLWKGAKSRYPKLAIPVGPSVKADEPELAISKAIFICVCLIPFTLAFDSAPGFVTDEIYTGSR